jgi:hypothetical protein
MRRFLSWWGFGSAVDPSRSLCTLCFDVYRGRLIRPAGRQQFEATSCQAALRYAIAQAQTRLIRRWRLLDPAQDCIAEGTGSQLGKIRVLFARPDSMPAGAVGG